jgi:hypothetical protein
VFSATFALTQQAISDPSAVNVTLLVEPCAPGQGLQNEVCTVCPAGTYALNDTQPYQTCPQFGICVGSTSVFVNDTYWPFIRSDNAAFLPLPCPYDYCSRGCDDASDPEACNAAQERWRLESACQQPALFNLTGAACVLDALNVSRLPQLCGYESHRTGVMCGECEEGNAYWDRSCLRCDATVSTASRAKAAVARLFVIFAPTVISHWAAQSEPGVAGFKMFVFVYQISSLAVFPTEILDAIVGSIAGLHQLLDALTNTWASVIGEPVCPFNTSAQGAVAVQLVLPLLKLLSVLGLWALQRIVLRLLDVFVARGSLWALRLFLLLQRGADRTGLIRTLLVVSITQFEGVVETLFSVLGCQRDSGRVYLIPAISCNDPIQGAATVLVVVASFLPVVMMAYLLWLRYKHELHDENIKEQYGVLYLEYSERWCFWEAWMLLRRVLLLGVFVLLVSNFDLPTAKMALSLVIGLLLVLHFVIRPFTKSLNNYLETFGLSILLLLIAVNGQSADALQRGAISIFLLVVAAVVLLTPLVWPVLKNLWHLVRSDAASLHQQQQQQARKSVSVAQPVQPSDLNVRLLDDSVVHPL